MGRMQRRVVVFIGAVLTLGVAALGCISGESGQGASGKKVAAPAGPPAFVGLSPSRGAIRVFDASGGLIREVTLDGQGWSKDESSAKGLLMFLKRFPTGPIKYAFDPRTGQLSKIEGKDSGTKGPPARGTNCGGEVYQPYEYFPFDSPFMEVFGADGKLITRVEVPHEKQNTKKFFLEVAPILCLDNRSLVVRALESRKPNDLTDRQETLYWMDLKTQKFQIIAGPRRTWEQDGFFKLAPSPRAHHFYAFEQMQAKGQNPATRQIVAFNEKGELWRTKIPQQELRNIFFGTEHDGRIEVMSIRKLPRHGRPPGSGQTTTTLPPDSKQATSTVFSLDINTGRIISELPLRDSGSSQVFASSSGRIFFIEHGREGEGAGVTVVTPGADRPKTTIRMSRPTWGLTPVITGITPVY